MSPVPGFESDRRAARSRIDDLVRVCCNVERRVSHDRDARYMGEFRWES